MIESNEMIKYYAKRALEYEDSYLKPERQKNINELKELLRKYFYNKNVLEIACGTGFWTQTISEVSTKIIAIDINDEVLNIAKAKKYNCEVAFLKDDAYILDKILEKYDSIFAGFWFSHIPKSKIRKFMEVIHNKLNEHALIVFIDNLFLEDRYLDENSSPISRFDTEGNSYQIRKLRDHSRYEVVKNFYDEKSLKECFASYGREIEIHKLQYFWIIKYFKN
jgi:demethylmenaquinone methyltransferase/2-methoxy-6-polyprenyl-1,4-benzoquinol methylase